MSIRQERLSIWFTYTTGDAGDDEFRRAAQTRAAEIEKQNEFDARKDKVIVRGVSTKSDFEAAIKEANAIGAAFGRVGSVELFSHAGPLHGPMFPGEAATNSQFSESDLKSLKMNWEAGGSARFFGCNTGLHFAQSFANAQGVPAYGYSGYAGFSSKSDSFLYTTPWSPLYLIHTQSWSNGGVRGFTSKYSGWGARAIPMVRQDPQP